MDLRLTLWDNSRSFFEEAIRKAIAAEQSPREWPFALLALVQAIELALKERLQREHALLVFANVDNPKKTVSLDTSIARLGRIGVTLGPDDLAVLARAKEWRDAIVHAHFDLKPDQLKSAFARLMGFYSVFSHSQLGQEVYAILAGELLAEALRVKAYMEELSARIAERIEREELDLIWVWVCRSCGFDAFVVQNNICTCYLCGHQEPVEHCHVCREPTYVDQMEKLYTGNAKGVDTWAWLCARCGRRLREDKLDDVVWRDANEG